uniref:thymidine kinase n=1 Tax=viral metagenome TaxID=1070528 RepID=A0A6C0J6M2_9ZZZZ
MIVDLHYMDGTLHVITGPMYSGKTSELLRLYNRELVARRKCILVKNSIDNRYCNDKVATHQDIHGQRVVHSAHKYSTISELMDNDLTDVKTIFIDEIQFFPDNTQCIDLLDKGINVVVSGLNGDTNQKMFAGMSILFSNAYDIKMLTAICDKCKIRDAPYTVKLSDNKDMIDVGGKDKYASSCRKCLNV